jgi:small redox-active disulfide protein 2
MMSLEFSFLIKTKGGHEMEIRILGPGCPRCGEVEKRTINALAELNVGADVQKVTEIKKITEYKIFSTPALVINGKVKASGRIPSPEEIKKWIQEEM